MIGKVVRIVLVVVGSWWLLFGDGLSVIGDVFREKQADISSCVKGDGAAEIDCPEWHVPGGGR